MHKTNDEQRRGEAYRRRCAEYAEAHPAELARLEDDGAPPIQENTRKCPECGLKLEFEARADQGYRLTCEDRTCGFTVDVDRDEDEAEAILNAYANGGDDEGEEDAMRAQGEILDAIDRWQAAEADSDPEQGHADAAAEGFTPGAIDPEVGRSYRVVDLEGATTDSIFRVVKAIDEHEFEIAGDSTMTGAYQKEDLRYSIRRGLVVDVTDEMVAVPNESITYTTHAPRRKRPTQKQINAAIRTIGALLAWREWDAEGTREFVGSDSLDDYAGALYDVATDTNLGTDEIVDAAMDQLGLTREGE